MTKESKIRLMESKLHVYNNGFLRAVARGDESSADKWKDRCKSIQETLDELKGD